jgi:hypothetical protein
MPSFDNLFMESKEDFIIYNGKHLVRFDRFLVKNGDILIASIENTNNNHRQGFVIDVTGYCEMDGEIFKKGKGLRVTFWQDTMPKEVKLKVFTKKDSVVVYNIWESTTSYLAYGMERESKRTDYFLNGAAMFVEEIENGRRYYCNDGEPDEDFDDIIFTVRKEVSP